MHGEVVVGGRLMRGGVLMHMGGYGVRSVLYSRNAGTFR